MGPVLILQHDRLRPPALLTAFLARAGRTAMTVWLTTPADLPSVQELAGVTGLVLLDEPATAPPWRDAEDSVVAHALATGIAVLALGRAAPRVARVAGAAVTADADTVLRGWWPLSLHPRAATRTWLERLGARPHQAFLCQDEALGLPPGALPLLVGPRGECQACVGAGLVATSAHLELGLASARAWLPTVAAELPAPAPGVMTASELLDALEVRLAAQRVLAETLFGHWLTLLAA